MVSGNINALGKNISTGKKNAEIILHINKDFTGNQSRFVIYR
jgi:hypothetical protein